MHDWKADYHSPNAHPLSHCSCSHLTNSLMNLTYSYMLAHVIMSENNDDSTFSFSTCSLLLWLSHPSPLNPLQLLLIPDFHWDSFMNLALGKVIINLKNFLLQLFLAFLLGMGLDKNCKHYWLYKTSLGLFSISSEFFICH